MVRVEFMAGKPVAGQPLEIVERKGLGHPDTICDSIMEEVSLALSRVYLEQAGRVLHHNVDKGLLSAGAVEKWFGGGQVIRPMELYIGDRATFFADGIRFPVHEIAREAATRWVKEHLPRVDPARHLGIKVLLSPGSSELTDIFDRPGPLPGANDTSAVVGYYPLSPTERLVLDLERHLNGPEFKAEFPETGEDVKIMGIRQGGTLDLTVAMPLLAEVVESEEDYFSRRERIRESIGAYLRHSEDFSGIHLHFNALDQKGRGLGGVYLSLLGTSGEEVDGGQVGRGNRVNGLIAVCRPLGMEAAAGKNPVSHVGKVYGVLAHHLARRIWEKCDGIKEVQVILVSRIGSTIDRPSLATLRLWVEPGADRSSLKSRARELALEQLAGIEDFCRDLSIGRYGIC